MRIRIAHETIYSYGTPAQAVIQTLRLTPRNFSGQHVAKWRIEVDQDCRLDAHEDAFGNITHTFSATGPIERLAVRVEGLVETTDTAGVVRGSVERFPPGLFLRETDLTRADDAVRGYATERQAAAGGERLATLHALMDGLYEDMQFDKDPTHSATTAAEAFHLKRGVCQDFAHIFIAAARHLAIPARYIGGYFLHDDGTVDQEAGHAWAEAYVDGLGWVSFDPANNVCPTEAHIRIAAGLDYLNAAPVRGTRYGGDGEHLSVKVQVDQAARQVQS
ncbi:transglutaminase family protein [Phreatobacter stygius]|uniref:Transglutaminase family protein n=1 Tax=Phreatobacter stygius TaxID=1940610 RepID=A0A4D7AV15_9HYPH|nr:transglutaminase family protein [Phreatobacter stygius]QCI62818.1 transglutaminase family protein [Phreatobacter stygius]